MGSFWKELGQAFLPSHWKEISQRPAGQGVGFFSRALLLAFVLILLLSLPALVKMPHTISDQLNKFEALRLSGNFTMTSPILLPRNEPLLIFDTSGAYDELTNERVLITKEKIFYRPLFKTYSIRTEALKDLKNNRDNVNVFLAALVFFLLPAILFWAYVAVWLKYFLMMLALSIIVFVVLDLTHWRRTWKELFVISCYVSTIPLLAEVIVGTLNSKLLIPILSIAGLVQLYLIPAVILAVLTVGAALCVHSNTKED